MPMVSRWGIGLVLRQTGDEAAALEIRSLSIAIELRFALIHAHGYGGGPFDVKKELDSGFRKPGVQAPRRSARVSIQGEVQLRRSGQHNYIVNAFDISREGCRLEFVERPKLDETVWVKFEGLEAVEATVCWVEGFTIGVEFVRPIHPAVFDLLVDRVREAQQKADEAKAKAKR